MKSELQRLIEGGATLSQEVGIYGAVRLAAIEGEDGPEFAVSYKAPEKGRKTENRYRGPEFTDALTAFEELARLEAVMASPAIEAV
jgi:hypothetical protein